MTAAALALATGPAKASKWRYPLYALAALSLGQMLRANKASSGEGAGREQAPPLICCKKVGGLLMRWEDHPAGNVGDIPVVMVHGMATNPRIWRYVIPPLVSRGVHCIAWEQVGFGGSMQAGLDKNLSIASQARYLHRFLAHMGIRKAVFVGHDYGGGVVQQLLVDHPEVVAGAVLCDPVAFNSRPPPAVRYAQAVGPLLKLFPRTLIKPFVLAAVRGFHPLNRIYDEYAKPYWSPYNRSLGPWALAHQLKFVDNRDSHAVGVALERANITAPMSVIWSGGDRACAPSMQRLASALGAPLIKVPRGRHFIAEDHPNLVAQVINRVVREAHTQETLVVA